MNGHAIGIILKELVRRATHTIRNERQVFEATVKEGYSGEMDDVLTSADTKAQAVYLKSLAECFPDYGVIAEEGSPPLKPGTTRFFTVDPLDGTKAFVRRQSHGIATMVALVEGGEVISAYIGDINTQEIYGYRPGSTKVHRITGYETTEHLTWSKRPISGRYILLRDPPKVYAAASQALLPRFKSYEVEGGSIGTWLARLWKGEVGAALIPAGTDTPWDMAPMVGISKALGYGLYRPTGGGWEPYEARIATKVAPRGHDLLVIHPSDAVDLGVSR
jgi:fructose-1,6-bisphosphatase/inositol monophosphatase family enzyme